MNNVSLRSIVPLILDHINKSDSETDLINLLNKDLLKLDCVDLVVVSTNLSQENRCYYSGVKDFLTDDDLVKEAQIIGKEFAMIKPVFYEKDSTEMMAESVLTKNFESMGVISLSENSYKRGFILLFSKNKTIPYNDQDNAWNLIVKTIVLGLKKMTDSKTEENALLDAYQKIDDLTESNKMLETFQTLAKGLVHDVNNMIAVIQGYTDLLKTELVDQPDNLDSANEIADASFRAKNLIQQFQGFVHSSQGTPIFYISSIIKEMIKKYRKIIPKTTISYDFTDETIQVETNPLIFEEIFSSLSQFIQNMNLEETVLNVELKTSRKMPSHPIVIKLSMKSNLIAKYKNIDKVFDAYFSSKSRTLVNSQAHFTKAEVSKGKLKFSIYFKGKGDFEAPLKETYKKILILDDEIALTKLGGKLVNSIGFEAECYNDSVKCLKRVLEKNDFGLMLIDQRMPELTGVEFAKKVLKKYPEAKIIMYSGYSDVTKEEALEIGIKDYLEKPVSKEKLNSIIKTYL